MLVERTKSSLLPVLILLLEGVIFSVFMFINLFFCILLGLTIIALVSCIHKRPILPRLRTRAGKYTILILVLLLASPVLFYYSTSEFQIILPAQDNPNFRVSFYCEFYNNATFTDSHLNTLKAYNSHIFLAINESQLINNSLAVNVTKRLNSANITVYAWLLLDQSKGYWAADSNVMEFEALVNTFFSWAALNDLEYGGVMVDSEPDLQRLETIRRQIRHFNLYGVLADLRGTATSSLHQIAQQKYANISRSIQMNGYESMVVGFPFPIDDLIDGDDDLQRLMGVSTIPPYNWNYSSFMIYRTAYREMLGADFGSYMIYSYGKTIWNMFGNSSSVSLSRIGTFPYRTLESLIDDTFIVKNLGFQEVIWIEFPKMIATFGDSGLNQLLHALNATRNVSFNYNPLCGYSRLILSLVDQIGIL